MNLGRERPRDPTWGTWILLQKWRCEPPTLGVLVPAPDPQCLCKHVARTRGTLANVPQQWISSSKPCLFCSARSSLVPAGWSAPWKCAWARVPFPDTCCFQARKYPRAVLSPRLPPSPFTKGSALSPSPGFHRATQTPPRVLAPADHQ